MVLDFELNKITVSLQADEKNHRRQALEEIMRNISHEEISNRVDILVKIWENIHRFLVKILNDNTEICRDLTINILSIFLEALPPDDRYIIYVIPIMSRRLGTQEQVESSEEVRLKCVSFLRMIISKYKDLLIPYIQDMTGILAHTVIDNYPNIKKESCKCISDYAKTLPRHFYSQSVHLIKPVLNNFMHQHYRVRLAAVEAIGDIIHYGNNKLMEEVATPLAQRLFDQSGIVREGRWLIDLPDRYSWWHKLLPLIMTGLHDELAEIRMKAAEMWDAAGKLYIKENENDTKLKDKMDFLVEDPKHYPPNISRPNLGCRVITQQNLYKLINGICIELGDWLPDIRVRSAQLLCVLILNVEEDITQHIEKLLPFMYRACNDGDKRVVGCVETAAQYLGYFIGPKIYCHLVFPTLEESITAGHLRIFAAIISGSEPKALSLQLETIASFLQQPHICQSKKSNYQQQMLSCCNSLLVVCEKNCIAITRALFIIIFTTYAMSTKSFIHKEANRLLEILVKVNTLEIIEDLFRDHMKSLIISIYDDSASWSVYSAESQIFGACLNRAGVAIARNINFVLPILKKTMGKDADSELKLQYFILLSEYFSSNQKLHRHIDDPKIFVNTIIEELIVPGLIWTAGRAAEAIRTAAICCLCAILQNKIINCDEKNETDKADMKTRGTLESKKFGMSMEQFQSIFDRIVPILISLMDDKPKKTRLYSMRAICSIVTIGRQLSCLIDEYVHRMYPVILKRLDDGCEDVRFAAVETLVQVWSAMSEDYDIVTSKGHIDALYTTMIIYLDDSESHFQQIILDALKRITRIYPELLHQKLHNCRLNFRNKASIDILLEHCQNILKKD